MGVMVFLFISELCRSSLATFYVRSNKFRALGKLVSDGHSDSPQSFSFSFSLSHEVATAPAGMRSDINKNTAKTNLHLYCLEVGTLLSLCSVKFLNELLPQCSNSDYDVFEAQRNKHISIFYYSLGVNGSLVGYDYHSERLLRVQQQLFASGGGE